MICLGKAVRRVSAFVLAGAVLSGAAQSVIVIELGTLRNGVMPPGGQPLLRASFLTIAPNTVRVTMQNLMAVDQFVDDWVFNSNKAITGFSWVSGVKNSFSFPVYSSDTRTGGSEMKAGLFDIEFEFPPPDGPDGNGDSAKFKGGMTSVYDLTGTGLTELDFTSVSVPGGNGGSVPGWYSAAHIGGFSLPQGNSGSIVAGDYQVNPQSVPEPATLALMGGTALAGYRRLRRKRSGL